MSHSQFSSKDFNFSLLIRNFLLLHVISFDLLDHCFKRAKIFSLSFDNPWLTIVTFEANYYSASRKLYHCFGKVYILPKTLMFLKLMLNLLVQEPHLGPMFRQRNPLTFCAFKSFRKYDTFNTHSACSYFIFGNLFFLFLPF